MNKKISDRDNKKSTRQQDEKNSSLNFWWKINSASVDRKKTVAPDSQLKIRLPEKL